MRRYTPDRETFLRMASPGAVVPVVREILADRLTPVSVFERLGSGNGAFLLESVEGGERLARYSFLGTEAQCILRSKGRLLRELDADGLHESEMPPDRTILDVLRERLPLDSWHAVEGLPRFAGGAVGYLSYDMVRQFERLPEHGHDDLSIDDACFVLTRSVVAFDHVRHRALIIYNLVVDEELNSSYDQAVEAIDALVDRIQMAVPTPPSAGRSAPSFRQSVAPDRFEEIVENCKEYIRAGDAFQIVPSIRFSADCACSSFELYRALRSINPSPYMYYLDFGDMQVVGSSPEILATVENREVTVRPIAGTRPRGSDAAEDERLAEELLADEKERAEHVMLIDLGRNDVGRVSAYGAVSVRDLMVIERYSHVMHIVSSVVGRLRDDVTAFDAVRACFPAGTLTGAPKVRAMEIINELEPTRRGLYGGAVGYFSFRGDADFAIAIRTMLVSRGQVHIQAGAGIVADSQPAREYEECVNKARAMLSAVEMAHVGLD